MKDPKQRAFELIQRFGAATILTQFNEGYSISYEWAKLYARIYVSERLKEIESMPLPFEQSEERFLKNVRKEIDLLKL